MARQLNGIPFDSVDACHTQIIDLRQHVVQAMAEFMEQCDDVVVGKQCWPPFAICPADTASEIAGEVGHWCLYGSCLTAPCDGVVHPGAATLGVARVQVEVELADQLARWRRRTGATARFYPEKTGIVVPDRRGVRFDVDIENGLNDFEQPFEHFRFRKILFYFLVGKCVSCLTQFFRYVRGVPGFERFKLELFAGERLQFGIVTFGKRLGARAQIVQEIEHLMRVARHFCNQ